MNNQNILGIPFLDMRFYIIPGLIFIFGFFFIFYDFQFITDIYTNFKSLFNMHDFLVNFSFIIIMGILSYILGKIFHNFSQTILSIMKRKLNPGLYVIAREILTEEKLKDSHIKFLYSTFSAHTMRHCWASAKLKEGKSLKAVSKYLGHSSTATTSDLYNHDELTFDDLKEDFK